MLLIELLYLLTAVALAVYGLNTLLHTLLYWHYRTNVKGDPLQSPGAILENREPIIDYPMVAVQIPVYNERHVVARVIRAVTQLDWPLEKLQIQILDDSTDDTSQIIASVLMRYQESDLQITHIHRPNREGFKAGALQNGMQQTSAEFIAIFDADFLPEPDFLQQALPAFRATAVGCVQTRWGHVNPETSLLTQAQALGIDGHFIIEQQVRHTAQALLNFNGTAGVWRRTCMVDAGGWQGDTLTEDLDLSYRAQLRGWQIVFQTDVVVPAELPVQITAFKRQQFRWAKGSLQTAAKLLGDIWHTPQPFWRKFLGTLHLTNYAVHPLMLLNLLLIFPMTFSQSGILKWTPIFVVSAICPLIMYGTTLQIKKVPWRQQLQQLAILVMLGVGLSVSNTKAALEVLFGIPSEFKRTPKFAVTAGASAPWQASHYTLPRDWTTWLELGAAFYAWGLLIYSWYQGLWWLVGWLLLYATGFLYISSLAFLQSWHVKNDALSGANRSI